MRQLRIHLASVLASFLVAGCALDPVEMPSTIGSAKMLPDRSIHLQLRADTTDGAIGDALFVIRPGDKDYESTLAHLGGLEPGQSKLVRPWPRK